METNKHKQNHFLFLLGKFHVWKMNNGGNLFAVSRRMIVGNYKCHLLRWLGQYWRTCVQHATTLLMAFRKKCCIWPWSSIVTPWYGVSDPTILQYIPIQLPTMREIKNLKMIYILFSICSGTLWDINTSSEVCFYFCFFLTMNKDKILTHFFPMFLFYIPWKNPRKSKVFLFSEGIKWENLPDMG